jgi:V/A-type H+-transporting ATPase subunit C
MVLKSANYVYIVTRAHGLSTHLFSEDELNNLVRAPSLDAYVESVMKGDYAEKIGLLGVKKPSAKDLNKVFSEVYVYRLIYLIKIASSGIKKFLDSFARRVEVENIKKIIRAKFHGLDISLEDLIPLPRTFSVINYQAMVESEGLDESLNLLGFTKYRDVVNRLSVSREVESTIPLEAFLDAVYYSNVFKSIKRIPDEKVLKSIIGTEIDLRNIYYIISYKFLNVPQRVVEESLVKPVFRFKEDQVRNLIKAREEAVVEAISGSPYTWLIPELVEALEARSIDMLEYTLSRLFKRFTHRMAVRNALGLGYVLGYLYNIEYEYRNLTGIAIGKELGWGEGDIRLVL